MPPPTDLTRKIKDILHRAGPLPATSHVPVLHYRHTANDIWDSITYVERAFRQGHRRPEVVRTHLGRLYGMALANLVEAFERLLKELAAACVDRVAQLVLDDRFKEFSLKPGSLASHFAAGTLGKALCESDTWLNTDEINRRFRAVLADPFAAGGFYLFPGPNQKPEDERWRYEPMSIVWQLRHTAVHNVGVITRSDAVKFRLLSREAVTADRLLTPGRQDIRHLGDFLDDTAESCNRRICDRLAELLTLLHDQTSGLFVPQEMADQLAADFRLSVTVAGATGVPPPD